MFGNYAWFFLLRRFTIYLLIEAFPRDLLDEIITVLLESGYPVNSALYNSYLSTVWALRLNVDLNQVTALFGSPDLIKYQIKF